MNSFSESYKEAGVDITAGYKAVDLMKKHIARTMVNGKATDIGGFGGLFPLNLEGIKNPVLVSRYRWSWNKIKISFFNGQTRYHRHRLCCNVCK